MTDTKPPRCSAPTGQPTVAITGASGYLGSVLAAAFESSGFLIRRLVRSPTPDSSDRFFDLNSVGTSEMLEGVDVLVHCAYDLSLTRRCDIWQTNVFGSTALLDLAVSVGVPRTIVLSSMSAYAGSRQLYARAKLATEMAAMNRGMCAIRPGLVYGPRCGGMAGTLRRLAALPAVPDFGPAAHQFTVREADFAAAVIALAQAKQLPSIPIGVAHPDPVPFADLLAAFATSQGKHRPRYIPTPPMPLYGVLRAAELLRLHLSVRADSLLGLIRPAPNVPNVEIIDDLGIALRPFDLAST